MVDPERPAEPDRLRLVRRHATERLGLLYDPTLVERIASSISARVRRDAVGEGITHADLVAGSGVPSWVAHRGLLAAVLALVAVTSYERHGFFLTALVRARAEDAVPSSGFCDFLEEVGLVRSRAARDDCLELWDHHWKMAVTHYDARPPAES